MRAVSLALLLVIPGCFLQATGGATYATNQSTGVSGELVAGNDDLRLILAQVSVRQLEHSGQSDTAVLVDGGGRLSLPGALLPDRDWARWVDFGGDAGGGIGADGDGPVARAWVGSWADVRLQRGHHEYPTLRAQIRRVVYTGNVDAETELFFGIGYTVRGANTRVPD